MRDMKREWRKTKMKAVNIKWDVTDGTEDMTKEDMDEILSTLPTEVEIPDNLIDNNEDFDEDYYYSDISDWLSDEYGFCHDAFELVNQQINARIYERKRGNNYV